MIHNETKLLLQRDYWRAMCRRERAVRMQPVSRAIDEHAKATRQLKRLRAQMRAAMVACGGYP